MRNPRFSGLLLAAATVCVLAFMMFGLALLPAGVRGLAAIAVFCLLCVTVFYHWRTIDEAAREAQKAAWLWGSVTGAVVAAFAAPAALALLAGRWPDVFVAEALFFAGIVYVMLAQALVFLAFWAAWWLRASASPGGAR